MTTRWTRTPPPLRGDGVRVHRVELCEGDPVEVELESGSKVLLKSLAREEILKIKDSGDWRAGSLVIS